MSQIEPDYENTVAQTLITAARDAVDSIAEADEPIPTQVGDALYELRNALAAWDAR